MGKRFQANLAFVVVLIALLAAIGIGQATGLIINPDGVAIGDGLLIDGVEPKVAQAYINQTRANPDFRRHALPGKPFGWAVYRDADSKAIVVGAYWKPDKAVVENQTGTTVGVVFDEATRKVVNGFVRRQTPQDDGTWLQETILFSGAKQKQVAAQPEVAVPNETTGDVEILHSYAECRNERYAECQSEFNDCVQGCESVCDGDSPLMCNVCRADCVTWRITCRFWAKVLCAWHRDFEH